MNTHILRNQLKAYMVGKKMSQSDLSLKTGVSQATISRFLAGRDVRSSHAFAFMSCLPPDLTTTPTTPPEGEGEGSGDA